MFILQGEKQLVRLLETQTRFGVRGFYLVAVSMDDVVRPRLAMAPWQNDCYPSTPHHHITGLHFRLRNLTEVPEHKVHVFGTRSM